METAPPVAASRTPELARADALCAVARGAGALAALLGIVALVGWRLGLAWLTSLHPSLPPLAPTSAVMGVLAGVALLLLAPEAGARRPVAAARACAAAGLVLVMALLFERARGQPGTLSGMIASGAPSTTLRTAASYGAIHLALLLFDRRTRRGLRLAEPLAVLAATTALAAFLGFLFGAPTLFGSRDATPRLGMGLSSVVSLTALSGGVLVARPRAGLMAIVTGDGLGGAVARRLLTALLAFPLLAVILSGGIRLGWYDVGVAAGLIVLAGMLVGASGVLVTARRLDTESRARRAAEESRAEVVQQAPDGIFVADLDGRYTDVNEAGCRLLGYTREEVVGKTIVDLIPPGEEARLDQDKEKMLRGGTATGDWLLRRKDGTFVPVEVSAKILADGRWQGFVRDITDRARMEQELRAVQADLTRAQSVARIGSWRLDVRRNELVWSDENYRIFGLPRGDRLTYEVFLGCAHPDDRAYVDRRWKAALRGEPYDIEHRIVVRGEVRWVREKAELEFDAAGRLLGGIGVTQDITDAKVAQEALDRAHANERRLRAELERVLGAGDVVSDALASLPEKGLRATLGTLAAQARELAGAEYAALGVDEDPSRPRPFETWILVGERATPSQAPELRSLLAVPVRYQGRVLGSLYLANKKGADAFSAQDEHAVGMLAGRSGFAIQTARIYASEALQRAWLETLFDAMPEGVVIVDEQGRVTRENGAAKALSRDAGRLDPWGNALSYDVRTPSGRPLPADEHPAFRALERREHLDGVELAMVPPEGELVPVLVSATPFRTQTGQGGAIMVFRDIRTLKELERLREEWTSIVAHDLRQPVSTISMATELLRRSETGAPSDEGARFLEMIRRAAWSLQRMIADLLDVSSIEARRLSVTRQLVDLRAVVDRVLGAMSDATAGFEVRVLAPGEQPAFVDPERIEQVLANLVSNAAKYGERGTAIVVELSSHDDRVEVAVTNHGAGIPPEELPGLFSRFARTRRAKESRVPGTGLGLYIAKGLVEAHGGQMSVASTPGNTTTFRFTLPRAAGRDERAPTSAGAPPPAPGEATPPARPTARAQRSRRPRSRAPGKA